MGKRHDGFRFVSGLGESSERVAEDMSERLATLIKERLESAQRERLGEAVRGALAEQIALGGGFDPEHDRGSRP